MIYINTEFKERYKKKWRQFFPKKSQLLKGTTRGFCEVIEDVFDYKPKRMVYNNFLKYHIPPAFHKVIVKCHNCGTVKMVSAYRFMHNKQVTCGSIQCRADYMVAFEQPKHKKEDKKVKKVEEAKVKRYTEKYKILAFLTAEMNKLKLQAFDAEDYELVEKYSKAIAYLQNLSITGVTSYIHCPLCGEKLINAMNTIVVFPKTYKGKKLNTLLGKDRRIRLSVCPKCLFMWAELTENEREK